MQAIKPGVLPSRKIFRTRPLLLSLHETSCQALSSALLGVPLTPILLRERSITSSTYMQRIKEQSHAWQVWCVCAHACG